jgi:hypothetical protein
MRGPTCIFWANLTPFSLQVAEQEHEVDIGGVKLANAERMTREHK